MATSSRARPWNIDDLQDVARQGEAYLKAVPVLILEKWVRGKKRVGVANLVTTEEVAERLVSRKLASPFKPKGTASVISVLTKLQSFRNLTAPPLVDNRATRRGEL
jgi:hypothetical protein